MNPDERETMSRLSKQLQEEKDPHEFTKLVREVVQLLQTKLNSMLQTETSSRAEFLVIEKPWQ